jgi:hypothetical protein
MPSLSRRSSPHVNTCEGSGYITAPILVSSQHQYGIEVIGPARGDVKWQANTAQGIDASQFLIDWEHQQAICPQGQRRISWTPAIDHRKNEVLKIKFSSKVCGNCPLLIHWTRSEKKYKRRTITLRAVCPTGSAASRPSSATDTSLCQTVCPERGHRSDDVSRGACLWHAPLPFQWPCQNAFAASCYGRGDECGSCSGMARWG